VLVTKRIGTDGTNVVQRQTAYNTAGLVTRETNAVYNVTSYSEDVSSGHLVRTTTYPDGSTRIETYYQDGSLYEVGGTGTQPRRFVYDLESDQASPDVNHRLVYDIRLTRAGPSGGTNEWTKTYSDTFGRPYKTLYAKAAGPYPYSQIFYNSLGQRWKEVDPDQLTTLHVFNGKGEMEYTIVDVNRDNDVNPNTFCGTLDRVTRTVVNCYYNGVSNVRRSQTYAWLTDNSATSTLIASEEQSTDGLQSWSMRYTGGVPVTTWSVRTLPDVNGNVTTTITNPDGSQTVSVSQYGRLLSVTRRDNTGSHNQVSKTTYGYDAQGRQISATDARNGTTWYTFDDADRVVMVTTPAPGTGASPESTTTVYDSMGRARTVTQPDGASVTYGYYLTGLLGTNYGARTYPVQYLYDGQGRLTNMTTWTNYAGGLGAAVTVWKYDGYRGWLTNKSYADGNGTDYSYTDGGRLKTRTWARTGSGQRIQTAYTYGVTDSTSNNDHGDLVTVVYSNEQVSTPGTTYVYDRAGRRKTVTRNGITTSLAWNEAEEILTEGYAGGTLGGFTLTSTYDAYLRRTNLSLNTSPTAIKMTNSFDTASRLQTVSDGAYTATYSYLANSAMVSQIAFSHGATVMTTTRTYDLLNRLLSSVSSVPAGPPAPASFGYSYNSANQRVRADTSDSSYWVYQYDALGQVISGKRYWSDGTPVAGQQFQYGFDEIGNRLATKAGGDQNGLSLRQASYTPNSVNQYTLRDVPGTNEVLGIASAAALVSVNGDTNVHRRGEYFRKDLAVNNGSAAQYPLLTVVATNAGSSTTTTGAVFLAQTPEAFKYDADGNLLSDGRWTNRWDAENRLVEMVSLTNAPAASKRWLTFAYDWQGRRILSTTCIWSNSAWALVLSNKFLYDGWNLIAELNATNNAVIRSYLWGLDLSGSQQGAGGVGGLVKVSYTGSSTTNAFASYDGNGNVSALVDGSSGTILARYDYGPFGEVNRATGPMAKANPFRFSTKYQDDETDLLYYGYRYYDASTGRWLSKDPINEAGFNLVSGRKGKFALEEEKNLYGFLDNDSLGDYDINGLSAAAAAGACIGGIAALPVEIPAGAIIVGTTVVAGVAVIVWRLCKCEKPKGCLPCNPVAGTLMYEIAPGSSRQRGKHVGIDHVKYWKMQQVPYMNPGPNNICQCYWRFDHTDDNTLIPVPGAIPGGPPTVVSGPSLGGGIAY